MSLEQALTSAGQIATWLTLILVFFTLKEMEKQRKAAQKPELIIPKKHVFGYSSSPDMFAIPDVWRNARIPSGENFSWDFPKITIYNIGFGAAKDVSLEWDFPLDGILSYIKDYCYQNSIPLVVSYQNGVLDVSYNHKGISAREGDVFSRREHIYALPISLDGKGLDTEMPGGFMLLLSVLACLVVHESRSNGSQGLERVRVPCPTLGLKLAYGDIGGGRYKKYFEVDMSFSTVETAQITDNKIVISINKFEFIERNKNVRPIFEVKENNVFFL